MPDNTNIEQSSENLRRRAEKHVGKLGTAYTDADARRMLHELDVYQIELELQNAELRASRDEAEALLGKYTELYDFALVGYFTLTTTSAILRTNLTGSAMVGVERANLIGRSFSMLIAPGQRAAFKVFLKQVFATDGKQTAEFELANANLATRVVLIKARCSSDGLECCAMLLDVTGRKETQEKLRVSENRYRRLFEAAHDGVLLLDPATSRIIDANPFMTKLLGYTREQLIGKELYEIGLLKDQAASRLMFRNLKKSHEVRYEDLPLKSEAGRHQEVEVVANLYQEDGHPIIQCNIRDITIRKVAEEMSSRNLELKKEIVERQKVEADLRANRKEQSRLLRQSRMQQKLLRNFAHRILNVQEEERKRISRELHDVIAQNLVGIQVNLELLTRISDTDLESAREQIARTRTIVEDAVATVHNFARKLRPALLDDLGLIPAIQAYLKDFMEETGIRVSLHTSAEKGQPDGAERTVLYRIAQEALANIARHSKASTAEIRIEFLDNFLRMTVKDNGQGFKPDGKPGAKKSIRLGLIGMKERAEMIGGTFSLDSAPGGPTTIHVQIPVN